MHLAGAANPAQVESWLGVYCSCSHGPPSQGSGGVQGRSLVLKTEAKKAVNVSALPMSVFVMQPSSSSCRPIFFSSSPPFAVNSYFKKTLLLSPTVLAFLCVSVQGKWKSWPFTRQLLDRLGF